MTSTEIVYGRFGKFRLLILIVRPTKCPKKRTIKEAKGVKERLYF